MGNGANRLEDRSGGTICAGKMGAVYCIMYLAPPYSYRLFAPPNILFASTER